MTPRFCLHKSTFKKCESRFAEFEDQCTISACAAIFLLISTYSFGDRISFIFLLCIVSVFNVYKLISHDKISHL